MENKKNIIWLASYPKSGNTWFRLFLTALLEKSVSLNKIVTNGYFPRKDTFETVLDIDTDYVNRAMEEKLQKLVYTYLSNTSKTVFYLKIHNIFGFSTTDNLPLIPEEPTKMAIYFVRNPLDIALSLANHTNLPIEKVIKYFLCNPQGYFGQKKIEPINQFHEPLGTWAMHVESWQNCPTFPVHFMRYEDMKSQPFETFKAAVTAIGLDYSDNDIQQAIEAVEFEKLQKKEQEKGFKEKQIPTSSFFFKGQVGRWKTELTLEQIAYIRTVNEPMMRHFGYWE